MNFSVAVDDHLLGMTHTIRAKDHIDNEKRQKYIYDYLKWKMPEHLYVGRINFEDLKLSSSETKELIQRKKFTGWDDIRLPFLPALRRRGYQPEAFIKYALDVGITENDKRVTKKEFFKAINNFNKEIIEPKADRYFLIKNKKKIKIQNAPEQGCQVPIHPDFRKRGYRKFKSKTEFIIEQNDFKNLQENKMHRLMDCVNFKKRK